METRKELSDKIAGQRYYIRNQIQDTPEGLSRSCLEDQSTYSEMDRTQDIEAAIRYCNMNQARHYKDNSIAFYILASFMAFPSIERLIDGRVMPALLSLGLAIAGCFYSAKSDEYQLRAGSLIEPDSSKY
ncbi:MAG TPA: hypothetical protein PLX15_01185 [Candidatus Woesearchaeota archaeon]|nr:hypothetical protein [Candidatus Woesearchaeota archaeon]